MNRAVVRQSSATDLAIALVNRGLSISEAARQQGLAISTVRRALRRAGVAPKKPGRPQSEA